MLPDHPPPGTGARGRDRPPVSEDPAPGRRLQPGPVHRPRPAVQSRGADRRVRGHPRDGGRGAGQPGAAAHRQGGPDPRVRRPPRRPRGHPRDPRAPAVGGRGDGPLHPRPRPREPHPRRVAPGRAAGRRDPRRPPLRGALRGRRGRAARPPRRHRTGPRGAGHRLPRVPGHRRRRPGPHLAPAAVVAGAVDGDEGRRQEHLLRRGHRGGAGAAARLHRPVSWTS